MSKVLALESISSMTRNELEYHFCSLGYDAEWSSFITEVSGGFSEDRTESLLRNFCHLNGIPVVIGPTIHLSQIPKPQCYVTRYSELEALALTFNRQSEWNDFFVGRDFILLDSQGPKVRDNWGVFWDDARDFLSLIGFKAEPHISSGLDSDTFLGIASGNATLSNLYLSKQGREIASLAANGIISTRGALDRLGITSMSDDNAEFEFAQKPSRAINPIRTIPGDPTERLVKRLGLQIAYDAKNPGMSARALIIKALPYCHCPDLLILSGYYGLDQLQELANEFYDGELPEELMSTFDQIERGKVDKD